MQALELQVHRLSRHLVRLRAAARDYLTALPSDRGPAATRLRHELGHAERAEVAA